MPLTPVARVITRLNIGGPAIQAITLTTALERHGFATRLLHGRLGAGEGDLSNTLPPTANAVFLPTLCRPVSPVDDVRTVVRLYREFRQLRPRVVHTHMAKAGLLGRLAATAYNWTRGSAPPARMVHTYHGHVLEGYFTPAISSLFLTLERLLARASDAIVAISPALQRELVDTYRIGRTRQYRVIPLGFDLTPFRSIDDAARADARARLALNDGIPVIATVGRLTAIKRHELFLEMVAHIKRRHSDIVALVAGDGERRHELQAYAQRLGLEGTVRWLGWRRDLATIYGATDVFVLTSRNEGTPVAIIEAMASGVATVSTDVGGVKDVIDSPSVGVLVGSADAAALAEQVEALLANSAGRRQMGNTARQRVLERYGVERLVEDIARLYRDLLSGG
jgi:glycosyltransferase involved in cell wall biosynthesis